jgi:hypothetical protein
MTPAIAAEFLTHNTGNRPIRRQRVEQIARDIINGRWVFDGAAITFDADGNLRGGQHRCSAVVLAGAIQPDVAVQTVVVRGVDPNSTLTANSGLATSAGDILSLSGVHNAINVGAALRLHSAWSGGGLPYESSSLSGNFALTSQELLDYMAEHPGLVDATKPVSGLRRALRLPASSLAVAIYETRRKALEDSEEFFRRIAESDLRGNGDPLVTMTRRVQRDISEKRTISQARGLFYLFRTWNAFRSGEVLQKIQVGGGNGSAARIPDPK